MADEFSGKQRTILLKLLHSAQSKTSANSLIAELQRQKENFPKKSLQLILVDAAKVDKLADHVYKELQSEFNSDASATQYLKRFLAMYDTLKASRKVTSRQQNIDPIAEDEEVIQKTQHKSTDNGNEVTKDNVKDILKKVVKAASDGLSQSAQIRSLLYESIKNNNNNLESLNEIEPRVHSQLHFSKSIVDALPSAQVVATVNCSARPVPEQEELLIGELLSCFIGIPGDYIIPQITEECNDYVAFPFNVSEEVDVSLRNIIQDQLPMAHDYSKIQKFAQWADKVNNQVLQALSEEIQAILNDYRLSVAQLEKEKTSNNLTLHKLHYFIRPNAQKLYILSELIEKITKSDLQSGTILSLLYDEITLLTGDKVAQKMLIELTERAVLPFSDMLERWILKGVIIDPYNQFFVIDNGHKWDGAICMEDYDKDRYVIQSDRIPRFLENDADMILRTGKYLNVIRQCGKQIAPVGDGTAKLKFSALTHQQHSTFIKQTYHHASKTLLELLMNENDLMGHITSVKRYFLLQQGDLITQFLDASEEELCKNVDKVAPVRLDNLLQIISRLSSAKNDPNLEYLHCDLFTMDLMDQMSRIQEAGNGSCATENFNLSGMECFTFAYSVQWPVSIVLNQWALSQYQMLFRLLFYCKHVERQLCKAWNKHIKISTKNTKAVRDQWRSAFALRQRMLNAIQHLEYYIMLEVIERNWHIFIERMKTVHNIDEVINCHQDFLHACLANCCLNHPDILRAVMGILHCSLKFAKFIQSDTGGGSLQWHNTIEANGKEFDEFLFQLLNNINGMTSEQLSGAAKLINLVHRINFNGYYSEIFEQHGDKSSP